MIWAALHGNVKNLQELQRLGANLKVQFIGVIPRVTRTAREFLSVECADGSQLRGRCRRSYLLTGMDRPDDDDQGHLAILRSRAYSLLA